MPIIRIGHFRASAGNAGVLLQFLQDRVRPLILASKGCGGCQILQGVDDDGKFSVIEIWESAEAHQASLKGVPPAMFAEVMPLLADKPSGAYYVDRSGSAEA